MVVGLFDDRENRSKNRKDALKINFKETKAYSILKDFLFKIDNSIKNKAQTDPSKMDPYLDIIEGIVEKTPLSKEPARFANAAMRDVISQICLETSNPYLRESFGNSIRMDYGTGHELNYLCYLYTQYAQNQLEIDSVSVLLNRYFRLVRRYIKKFNIEAAGARGCWSVDDYQFLPYLFGSAENFRDTRKIMEIQEGMFYEAWFNHGDMGIVANICKLSWPEINIGLFKMYDEEVLGKHVVTQHFIYSDFLPK
ncbi:serine/threonine-protein phosphatase 2A activator [Pancytospora epiphaga]|nr:serine/threonine-protein phosphatase 2A activator [Pancytospora epiphaga]